MALYSACPRRPCSAPAAGDLAPPRLDQSPGGPPAYLTRHLQCTPAEVHEVMAYTLRLCCHKVASAPNRLRNPRDARDLCARGGQLSGYRVLQGSWACFMAGTPHEPLSPRGRSSYTKTIQYDVWMHHADPFCPRVKTARMSPCSLCIGRERGAGTPSQHQPAYDRVLGGHVEQSGKIPS